MVVLTAIALLSVGFASTAAATEISKASAPEPCSADFVYNGARSGAISKCPPGTYRHWHQAHVTCFNILFFDCHGPVVGGTSESVVWCPHEGQKASRVWNTQGPDD